MKVAVLITLLNEDHLLGLMTKNSSIPVTAWIEYNFFFILFSILVYHPIKVVVIYSLNSKVRLVAR